MPFSAKMLQIWIIGKYGNWSGDEDEAYDNASDDAGSRPTQDKQIGNVVITL